MAEVELSSGPVLLSADSLEVGGMPWGHRLGRDLVIYGLGGSAAKVVNALLLPIMTRVLTPVEFGAIDLLTSVASIILVVGGLGLQRAFIYFYTRTDDPAEHRRVTSTVFIVALTASAVTSVIAFGLEPLLRTVVGSPAISTAYVLTLVYVPIALSSGVVMDILRAQFRSRAFAGIGFLGAIGTVVLAIAIVVATGTGVTGYVVSQIAVSLAVLITGAWLVRASLGARPSVAVLRRLLGYGLPFVPVGISAWVFAWSDRVFLAAFGHFGDLGYYAAANRVAQVTFLAVLALQTAWTPFAMTASREANHRPAFVTVFRLVSFGLLLLVAITSLAAGPLVQLALPKEYSVSVMAVPFLAGSVAAQGLSGIVMIGLTLTARTGRVAMVGVATAASVLLLNFLLIPPFGIVGAALATFGSSVLSLFLYFVAAERAYPVGYPGWRLVAASACVAAAIAFVLVPVAADVPFGSSEVWLSLRLGGCAVLIVFAAIVLGLGPLMLRGIGAVRTGVRGTRAT